MEVVLVDVELNVLVKSKVPPAPLINKGLDLVDNCIPCSYSSWSTKELGI